MSAREVAVEQIMGMPVSIHVHTRGELPRGWDGAVDACFAELRALDRVFSPFRDDSDISRMRRGELALADAHPAVAEVAAACERAEAETGGLFSAGWRGGFDPTGYVKGWAVERAARHCLTPLAGRPGVAAVGINAGGDMQLFRAPGSGFTWRVGIADPFDPDRIVARIELSEGAVATSGSAERGAHILDPRTGEPATGVVSATTVADSLARADLWATAAVVAGRDLRWIAGAGLRSGLIVASDGGIRRFAGGLELVAPDALLAA